MVNRQTRPSLPRPEITELETVAPAAKLRFDVGGCVEPQGNTVTNPAADGAVTVTVRATADTLICQLRLSYVYRGSRQTQSGRLTIQLFSGDRFHAEFNPS